MRHVRSDYSNAVGEHITVCDTCGACVHLVLHHMVGSRQSLRTYWSLSVHVEPCVDANRTHYTEMLLSSLIGCLLLHYSNTHIVYRYMIV